MQEILDLPQFIHRFVKHLLLPDPKLALCLAVLGAPALRIGKGEVSFGARKMEVGSANDNIHQACTTNKGIHKSVK